MLTYVARRLLLLVPMAVGMIVVTFGLLLLLPGDPALVLLGVEAEPEAIESLRNSLGLNDPSYLRLWHYFTSVLQGDLGRSIFLNQSVSLLIWERLGATIELAFVSLALASVFGLALGVIAAIYQGTFIDTIAMIFAQLGVSIPVYWLGLLLMLWFAVILGWLPSIGRGEPLFSALGMVFLGRMDILWDSLRHILLPALALAANSAAIISRLVRSSMLELLSDDFIRTAKAKGLRYHTVILRHALRNALLPVLSIIGLRFGALLGGAVLVESIFAWPGLGQLTISAISQRDVPLIQGVVLSYAVIFALVTLVVDLLYAVADPRVRLG
jgi:peptide/nickel transport system permease protein